MTWVVGASTLFGYGVVISDIQVSCPESGFRMDVLQKAYPVGKYIVAGFAGSVYAGLTLLQDLADFLHVADIAADECWEPQWVADNWQERARGAYGRLREEAPVGDTDVLMVGLQPKERVLGNAIGHIAMFRSPEFVPVIQTGGRRAASIGCGSGVGRYTEVLEALMLDEDLTYMKFEIGSIGGYGRCISNVLHQTARQHPTDGISEHFHLFLVRMGKIERWDSSGMPEVARNWPDLLRRLEEGVEPGALVAGTGVSPHGQR